MSATTLNKVLNVREREKLSAQKDYNLSIATFENVATKLYSLLKKKEEAQESQEISMQVPTSIEMIKYQSEYIEQLTVKIANMQKEVQLARYKMDQKHEELTEAHVEVKKFEKMIEIKKKTEDERLRKEEAAAMDEISIQQYLSQIK